MTRASSASSCGPSHAARDPVTIRVAILDSHHAERWSLTSAVQSEPGIVPVSTAASVAELAPSLYRSRADVLLLDCDLSHGDGLIICHELKSQGLSPAIIVHSDFADDAMTLPAIVAGADAVLNKRVSSHELFAAIREVNRGGSVLPAVSSEHLEVVRDALQERDLPILGMLLARTPVAEVAAALRVDRNDLRWRMGRMLAHLIATVGPITAHPPRSGATNT